MKSARVYPFLILLTAALTAVAQNKVSITTTSIANGTVGVAYSQQIQVSGGVPPYTFTLTPSTIFTPSNPPPGLTLSASGLFSGTPTKAGSYTFGITVKDSGTGGSAAVFSINIGTKVAFTTASPLPSAAAGTPYSQTIFVTGGTAPYTFSFAGTPPPGLTISSTGTISGTPSSVGTFPFTVQVADNFGVTASNSYSVTFTAGPPQLVISALAVSFEGQAGGDASPSQSIAITSASQTPINYAVKIDSGGAGSAAPSWLTVKPSGGSTPGRLTLTADPGSLQAGTYLAALHVSVPGDLSQTVIDIAVSFQVSPTGPSLEAFPNILKFAARASASAQLIQPILLHNNGGGGGLPFNVSLAGKSTWVSSISPGSGQTSANSTSVIQVQVNTTGLQPGPYRDVLNISWLGGTIQIPLVLFVTDQGSILDLSQKGIRFPSIAGAASASARQIKVLNRGDASTTVHWTADVQGGSDWLTILSPTGTATPATPGAFTLRPGANVANLPAGPRYSLVRVVDPNALNSPQYLTAVFDVAPASTAPSPHANPAGTVFVTPVGSRQALTSIVNIEASSNAGVNFQASASTNDGLGWLSVSPVSGPVQSSIPGTLNITANPSNLNSGIYSGEVVVAIGSQLKVISVTFVVTSQTFAVCSGTRLAITPLALTTHFSIPAGWPATLSTQLTDDCGNPVFNAFVFASFSNGDPAVVLAPDGGSGTYTAAWPPGTAAQQMNVTLHAISGGLLPASSILIGDVLQNNVPTLAANGTLNNLNTQLGGALSPGDVAQVFGTNLATTATSTIQVPLFTTFNGTGFRVGALDAPLYYVSGNQLTVQIPTELAGNRQYAVVESVNGAYTLPDTINVAPVSPGVAALSDGTLIAQHADFSLVTDQNPAHRGEVLTMYLVGMGQTNPSVASGHASPAAEPFARPLASTAVTLDNQPVQTSFIGMTPNGVGLFQINFQVPLAARTGVPLDVVVKENGIPANTTKLNVVP